MLSLNVVYFVLSKLKTLRRLFSLSEANSLKTEYYFSQFRMKAENLRLRDYYQFYCAHEADATQSSRVLKKKESLV